MIGAPHPPVIVRPAEVRDVERVAAIEDASFADPWTTEAFHSSLTLPHMRFLVAEASAAGPGDTRTGAAATAGYVLAMVLGPEGEIADIAVAPEARGRGIGGVLLDAAVAELRRVGVRTVYLEVRESNLAARRLYESRGFGDVGRRRGYYQHPVEDALVLRREIAPT
jgi:ribosomal-protein-alanine N-acetyltransferase